LLRVLLLKAQALRDLGPSRAYVGFRARLRGANDSLQC